MIMRQMPDEEQHDASHNQARYQLPEAESMEDDARVMRGRRFGTAVEGVEHCGGDSCLLLNAVVVLSLGGFDVCYLPEMR